jgi:hypothetical protein
MNRYEKRDYCFEGGSIPYTVKVPDAANFHALLMALLPEECSS